MSFGFSVGDFIAVGQLIVRIVDTLQHCRTEYQELIRELERYFKERSIMLRQPTLTTVQLKEGAIPNRQASRTWRSCHCHRPNQVRRPYLPAPSGGISVKDSKV